MGDAGIFITETENTGPGGRGLKEVVLRFGHALSLMWLWDLQKEMSSR